MKTEKSIQKFVEKFKETFFEKERELIDLDNFMMHHLKDYDGNYELKSIQDADFHAHLNKGIYCYSDFIVYFDTIRLSLNQPLRTTICVYHFAKDGILL